MTSPEIKEEPMEYLHTMVRVTDLEQSLGFYCEQLGLVQVSRRDYEAGRFSLIFDRFSLISAKCSIDFSSTFADFRRFSIWAIFDL